MKRFKILNLLSRNGEKRETSLFFGRVQVLKTFALSKLILPATILDQPRSIAKIVNKINR